MVHYSVVRPHHACRFARLHSPHHPSPAPRNPPPPPRAGARLPGCVACTLPVEQPRCWTVLRTPLRAYRTTFVRCPHTPTPQWHLRLLYCTFPPLPAALPTPFRCWPYAPTRTLLLPASATTHHTCQLLLFYGLRTGSPLTCRSTMGPSFDSQYSGLGLHDVLFLFLLEVFMP